MHFFRASQQHKEGPNGESRQPLMTMDIEEAGQGMEFRAEPKHAASVQDKMLIIAHSVSAQAWTLFRPYIFTNAKRKLHPSSWLDGVRGVAAFFVVFHHLAETFVGSHIGPFTVTNPHVLQMPIIRTFYTGAAMVTVFFVVSGYALSYKPLQLTEDSPKLLDNLASSTFRRAIRIYLPCAAINFLSAWTSYFDLFEPGAGAKRIDSVFGTLAWWMEVLLVGFNPFNATSGDPFSTPLIEMEGVMWTIPFEYRGSIVIFVVILGIAKMPRLTRLVFELAMMWYMLYLGLWDVFLFVSGIMCCDLHHCLHEYRSPKLNTPRNISEDISSEKSSPRRSLRGTTVGIFAFFLVLYILSMPPNYAGTGDSPLYPTLVRLTPPGWVSHPDCGTFWRCLSAVSLILVVDNCMLLRTLFSSRFPQYLGDISFSIYLIHAYLIKILGRRLVIWVFNVLPSAETMGATARDWVGFSICLVLFMPVVFWAADILTRHLDRKSVTFARWVEGKLFRKVVRSST